jgi:hypothetical protein
MAKRKTRAEVERLEVEKKLGYALEDEDWDYLEYAEYVADAIDSGSRDALLARARQLSAGRSRAARSGRVQLPPTAAGDARVTARARVRSQLIANEAAQDLLVIDYRLRHLGGCVIEFVDAQTLLDSPAACLVPADVLALHGVSLLGHSSRIFRTKHVGCDWCWPDDRAWVDYEIDVAGTTTQVTAIDAQSQRRLLAYQSAGRPKLVAGVGNGSPLDELLDLANAVAGAYGWRSSEAAAFVLEGSVPFVPPIEVTRSFHVAPSGRTQATVTLAVDPSVPAAEVARAYGDAQDLSLRKDPKATNARTMAAVAFVAQRQRDQPDSSWPDLMSSFNDTWVKQSEGEVGTFRTVSAFQQAVGRGITNLLGMVRLPPEAGALLQPHAAAGANGAKRARLTVLRGSSRASGSTGAQRVRSRTD